MRQLQALNIKLDYMKRRWSLVSKALKDCSADLKAAIDEADIEKKAALLNSLLKTFNDAKIVSQNKLKGEK